MKKSIPYVLAALFVFAKVSAFATNYYVDPSASGSNQGTLTNPWKSLADVPQTVNYFSPGDTVFFKRGQQFTGPFSINSSGSNGSPIVFMPYGSGNAPVIQYNLANPADSLVYNRSIISISQVNYIVIDGFELTDVTIPETNHNVDANVGYGVYIYNGSNNIIKNLTISKLGAGVTIDGGSYNTVTNCNIGNLRMIINTPDIMWDDFGANGVIVEGSNNTVSYNNIHDCWSNSYDYIYDGGAVEMYGTISNNNISYNTTSENLGFMEFGSGTAGQALNNLVAYNLSINNGHVFWINSNGGFGVDVRNLQFYNNNIVETHPSLLPDVHNLIGIATTPTGSNVITMKNNIFWINTALNVTDPTAQPFNGPALVHQSNLFHLNGGSVGYTMDATEQLLNLSAQVFTNMSSSDPTQWNYNLTQSSGAIQVGQNVGISKDFYGQPVPVTSAPDAGIVETQTLSILPLKMLSFKGWAATDGNNLVWVTSTDSVNHFEVERSNTGDNFQKIATVPYKESAGLPSVNYQFIDNDATDAVVYYRIKIVEPGNTSSYSQIITIKSGSSSNKMTVSPNPAQDYVYVKMPGSDFQNKEMALVNMSGVTLQRTTINDAGTQVKVNVSMLPRGAYVIKLTDKTGSSQSAIFMK
jgi:hypothetical protein